MKVIIASFILAISVIDVQKCDAQWRSVIDQSSLVKSTIEELELEPLNVINTKEIYRLMDISSWGGSVLTVIPDNKKNVSVEYIFWESNNKKHKKYFVLNQKQSADVLKILDSVILPDLRKRLIQPPKETAVIDNRQLLIEKKNEIYDCFLLMDDRLLPLEYRKPHETLLVYLYDIVEKRSTKSNTQEVRE